MKNRNLWKMFLLEIVTFGIYRLYFFIKTRKEMMALNPSIKIKSAWLLIAPAIVIAVAFAGLIVITVATAPKQTQCTPATFQNSSTSYNGNTKTASCPDNKNPASLIAFFAIYPLFFIAFILVLVWEWSYARGVETITGNKLSFALTLIILLVVPDGIDILIVQDYFNKVGESPVAPVGYAQPAPLNPAEPATIEPTAPTNPTPPSYPQ